MELGTMAINKQIFNLDFMNSEEIEEMIKNRKRKSKIKKKLKKKLNREGFKIL